MMREVVTPRRSRFLLCTMSWSDPRYAKYPPQPIVGCEGYRAREKSSGESEAGKVGDEPVPARHPTHGKAARPERLADAQGHRARWLPHRSRWVSHTSLVQSDPAR
jgi:hypothetical protein